MQDDKSKSLVAIESFEMKRFAKGLMWDMQYVFGLEVKYLLYEPDENEGRYILNQVMTGATVKRIRVKGSLELLPRY